MNGEFVYVLPNEVLYIGAAFLWIVVVWLFLIHPIVIPKFQDYFAQRRHDRRLRNYAKQDAKRTLELFNTKPVREFAHAKATRGRR